MSFLFASTGGARKSPAPAPAAPQQVLRKPGERLDPATRLRMEFSFGRTLSGVRVHADDEAAASAAAMGARAYTVGSHIVFGRGEYAPASRAGEPLLAHELAHTVQQGDAPPPAALAETRPGDAAEREADGASAAVARGAHARPLGSTGPRLARQAAPSPDPGAETEEEPPIDKFAGTPVSEIVVSLARGRIGFQTRLGMILGDVVTDLKPGRYKLRPDLANRKWVIVEPAVNEGLRFDVSLEGADPWTLAYPETLELRVAPGSLEEPKTFGDMLDDDGLADPLWLHEGRPPELQPQPVTDLDDFDAVHYDLHYRSEGDDLSMWLVALYRDDSRRDIHLDTITSDKPRLWAAKQEAIRVMEEYNLLYILNVFPAVWFILTASPMAPSTPKAAPRYRVSRRVVPRGRGGTPPKQDGAPPPAAPREPVPPSAAGAAADAAAPQVAKGLAGKLAKEGKPVVANIGGAGAKHEPAGAININNQAVGRKNIPNHVNADGSKIGKLFDPATLDRIEGHNMAPGAVDWAQAAPGAYKVLKPGGTIRYSYRGANADAAFAGEQLRKAGFKDVQVISEVLILATKP